MKVFILFYKNKFQFSIETYVKSRGLVLASPTLCLHCRKIHNLFVRALETGRKVHERKLSSLLKKLKESCKLDINQSVPEVKRKQCGGDRYYANIRA
jgi:hypothetical protein